MPQAMIPARMKDPDVLDLADLAGRIVVSHDVTTMPRGFDQCVEERKCAKIAVLAPIPSANDVIATAVNPGL